MSKSIIVQRLVNQSVINWLFGLTLKKTLKMFTLT